MTTASIQRVKVPRYLWPLLAWLLLVGLCGCDQKALLRKFTPEAEDRFARGAIDHMLNGRVDALLAMFPPGASSPELRKNAEQLVGIFQHGSVKSIEVIGAYTQLGMGAQAGRTVQLSYQLELSTGWFAGMVVIADANGAPALHNIRFNSIPGSLEKLNALTFTGKSAVHFLMFALLVSIPIFCITVVVVCARSPIRRKWLWIIFILLGFVSFEFNWTSGEIGWQLINFRLLGASAFKAGPYAPWMIGIAIPVGAIVFLLKRKKLIAHNFPRPATELPPAIP